MSIRPLTLHSLAWLPRPSVVGAPAIATATRAVLGKKLRLRIPPLGQVMVSCTRISEATDPDQGDAVWALSRARDERRGFLSLNGLTALRLVAGTFGVPVGRNLRELGAAERGIVAAIITDAFRAAGSDILVGLSRKVWRGGGLVRLIVEIEHDDIEHFARVDVPPDWLPAPDQQSWLAEALGIGLEIPMRVELARTNLKASDWADARIGDAIVFDDVGASRTDAFMEACLVCGEFAARIRLTPDGAALLTTEFRVRSRETSKYGVSATTKENENMPTDSSRTSSLTMLAAAPLEVVAEIGRVVMRADGIVDLKPGSVLTLGELTSHIVELRVGDRTWARGELVDVDGQLGVRLTSLVHHPISPPEDGSGQPER